MHRFKVVTLADGIALAIAQGDRVSRRYGFGTRDKLPYKDGQRSGRGTYPHPSPIIGGGFAARRSTGVAPAARRVTHACLHRETLMASSDLVRILLLLFSVVFGVLVGILTVRVPAFTALGMPSFLWLVAGLFAFEMLAGLLLNAHPSALLTMPWRAGGLALSFLCCYAAIALLS